jgi:hypothetical protein
VVVWFAQGYRGFMQGDDAAIKRGIPTNARDVEFVLKKAPEGESPMGMPRPAGGGPVNPPAPRPPGMGGGTTPVPVPGR